jgi:hypothetical protein
LLPKGHFPSWGKETPAIKLAPINNHLVSGRFSFQRYPPKTIDGKNKAYLVYIALHFSYLSLEQSAFLLPFFEQNSRRFLVAPLVSERSLAWLLACFPLSSF